MFEDVYCKRFLTQVLVEHKSFFAGIWPRFIESLFGRFLKHTEIGTVHFLISGQMCPHNLFYNRYESLKINGAPKTFWETWICVHPDSVIDLGFVSL